MCWIELTLLTFKKFILSSQEKLIFEKNINISCSANCSADWVKQDYFSKICHITNTRILCNPFFNCVTQLLYVEEDGTNLSDLGRIYPRSKSLVFHFVDDVKSSRLSSTLLPFNKIVFVLFQAYWLQLYTDDVYW